MSDLIAKANAAHPALTTHGIDYKAWAKRIVYREERGDERLLAVQVAFAREALGLEPKTQ